jgi:two-component system response regulator VanR
VKSTRERHKPRILIVDDENTVAETLRVVLELRGYKVLTTDNGKTALDVLYRQKIDLAILDLMLPEVDGLAILRRMREDKHLADTPVIIITVVTQGSDLADGFWQNATQTEGFVTKPFDPFQLADKVDAILAARGMHPTTA